MMPAWHDGYKLSAIEVGLRAVVDQARVQMGLDMGSLLKHDAIVAATVNSRGGFSRYQHAYASLLRERALFARPIAYGQIYQNTPGQHRLPVLCCTPANGHLPKVDQKWRFFKNLMCPS